jgi:hypothetical protein
MQRPIIAMIDNLLGHAFAKDLEEFAPMIAARARAGRARSCDLRLRIGALLAHQLAHVAGLTWQCCAMIMDCWQMKHTYCLKSYDFLRCG